MAPIESNASEDAPELQIVTDLKAIDDKYLELEKECQKKMQEVARKFEEKQRALLEQRAKRLAKAEDGSESGGGSGTPAVKGFWATALSFHPGVGDQIHAWDVAVLEYLTDITKENLDKETSDKGFKLTFHFSENPYFEHKELTKEYHSDESSPYTGEIEPQEIKSTQIVWKSGKDVTVAAKKKEGKSGKKTKGSQGKKEDRPSFFRTFFRNLKDGDEPPVDMTEMLPEELMGDDEDSLMRFILEGDFDAGCAIRDYVIPYATRWYTGEAVPEDDDSDEDDESEDEDESDSDSDDSPPGKGKGKRGGAGPKKAAATKKKDGEDSAAPKEECKQQ